MNDSQSRPLAPGTPGGATRSPWNSDNEAARRRTDALDRFGTRLERRFTKAEMHKLMEEAGLENITFSTTSFWTAIGYRVHAA